jgi:hypothetical protein
MTIGKQQGRIAMRFPEPAQQLQRRLRQRNEAVFIAFGVADMDALTRRIDVANPKAQSFAQT